MEVAGDPGALLGYREATLALRLALGALGALLELSDVLSPQARSLAGEPRDREGEPAVQQLAPREAPDPGRGGPQEGAEEHEHGGGGVEAPRIALVPARRRYSAAAGPSGIPSG